MTDRAVSGETLQFNLGEEITRTLDRDILDRSGRNARTLLKEGALRVTLITLAAGGGIMTHHAAGPIMVQVLRGQMVFKVSGREYPLAEGDALAVPPAVDHSVRSEQGASFLLIIAHPDKIDGDQPPARV